MTRRWLSWVALIAAVAAALAFYWLAARQVPAGQPPLTTLDEASIETLRSDFNSAADRTRVIVLLSPT